MRRAQRGGRRPRRAGRGAAPAGRRARAAPPTRRHARAAPSLGRAATHQGPRARYRLNRYFIQSLLFVFYFLSSRMSR